MGNHAIFIDLGWDGCIKDFAAAHQVNPDKKPGEHGRGAGCEYRIVHSSAGDRKGVYNC